MVTLEEVNYDTASILTCDLEEEVLGRFERNNQQVLLLPSKVQHLHTNILYYSRCGSQLSKLCQTARNTIKQMIGGHCAGWRRLGELLDVSRRNLDYIENSVNDDKIDTVLRVYMQDKDSTLDKLLNKFIDLGRLDILKALEETLSQLSAITHENFQDCLNKSDTGYQTNQTEDSGRNIIYLNIPNQLPDVLKSEPSNIEYPELPPIQFNKATPGRDNRPGNEFTLLLTFAKDGLETALRLKDHIMALSDELSFRVIILNDVRNQVLENPVACIRQFFEMAHYVIPVITKGYINAIESTESSVPNELDFIDFNYVHYIFTLITNYYVHAAGCRNKKTRSVTPYNVDGIVFAKLISYPSLVPWIREIDFDAVLKMWIKEFSKN